MQFQVVKTAPLSQKSVGLIAVGLACLIFMSCTASRPMSIMQALDNFPPAPGAVVKRTQAAEVRLVAGSDYLETDADYFQRVIAEHAAKQVVFDSAYPPGQMQGLDGLAYCMYQFTLPNPAVAPMLRWQWSGAEPGGDEFYIGLPNRGRDAWEWHAAGEEGILDVSAWSNYLDGEQLLVALAVAAQGEFRLDWIKVGGAVTQTQVLQELQFSVEWTAAAIVQERPAIAYIDSYNYDLLYIRANDYYGFSWGEPVLVADFAEYSCSMAIVNGRPAIAFDNSGHVAYSRATNSTGSAWEPPVEVTTVNDSGNYCSLAMVNGQPAVSSETSWTHDLLFTRSTNETGGHWAASQTPDNADEAGAYSSLALVDGNPAIAYIVKNQVRFVRATDADGAAWAAPVTVVNGYLPSGTCLAVVNGYPAISFINVDSDVAACYVIAKDAQGQSWWGHSVLPAAGAAENKTSLAVIGKFPAVAFGTWTPYVLWYATANDLYGSNWDAPVIVDQEGQVGYYPTLFEVRGQAGFAYGENTNSGRHALKYAILFE